MSLTSEFYLGDPKRVLAYCNEAKSEFPSPEVADAFLSLSTRGIGDSSWMFASDLAVLADILARRRGMPPSGLKRYVDAFLVGKDRGDCERQVLLMKRLFAEEVQSMTETDVQEFERSVSQQERDEDQARHHRMIQKAKRPIQTPLDLLAFGFIGAFAWMETRSFLWVVVWLGLLALVAVGVLPWIRLRRAHRDIAAWGKTEPRPIKGQVQRLMEFCEVASRSDRRVIYEWSI